MSSHVYSSEFEVGTRHHPALYGRALRWLAPVGRLLFAGLFLMSVPGHFTAKEIGYAAAQGVPLAQLAVPLAGVIALLGGLSVLLGYKTRYGALLLAIFLIPVTLMMHRFWAVTDPQMAQMQMIQFMKNMALLGATSLIGYFGAGPISLDNRAPRVVARRRYAIEES
jgi:putative oxidoreductase